jgi:hypothetical protein
METRLDLIIDSMKVLNLQCFHNHAFEGWFGSEDEFQEQLSRGLVECPLCGDVAVTKMPSAPRLNLLGTAQPQTVSSATKREVMATTDAGVQAEWLRLVRHVMANTEDVGERFPEEARRIHYGESEERSIRGEASREETQALLEEGIGVLPLPVPKGLKGPLQ